MQYRGRFAAAYAALAMVVAASAAGTWAGVHAAAPREHRCWASAPDLPGAMYSAAICRFGKENVSRLGWMPHIGVDGVPSRTLEEVAVIHLRSAPSYWLAHVRVGAHRAHVEQWTPCGSLC